MTGFIRGFFRSQPQQKEETVQASEPVLPKSKKKAEAFFLDPDDAKTFGDIEYMRTSKSIRRTFPKFGTNGSAFETISQISALQNSNGSLSNQASVTIEPISPELKADVSPDAPAKQQEQQRKEELRQSDNSMDLFRNMAREIRKR